MNLLFEEDMQFIDWLDWFYTELPYINDIANCNLVFTNSKGKVSILDIKPSSKVNIFNGNIVIEDVELITINNEEGNLYNILSI